MPTVNEQVGAGADNYWVYNSATFVANPGYVYLGRDPAGYDEESGGFRFTTVNVPNGATITAAKLSFYGSASAGANVPVTIYGVDEDDFVAPTTYAEWAADPHTAASVAWTLTWVGWAWYDSPDIKTIIQEIVDRPGWAANQDMGFKIISTDVTSSNEKIYYGHLTDSALAGKLEITYTSGVTITAVPLQIPIVVPAHTITSGALIEPSPVAVPIAVPTATITLTGGPIALTPSPVQVPIVVPAATLQMGAKTLTPSPVQVPIVIPAAHMNYAPAAGVIFPTPRDYRVHLGAPDKGLQEFPEAPGIHLGDPDEVFVEFPGAPRVHQAYGSPRWEPPEFP